MSTIIRCDGDDCYNLDTNYDEPIYSLTSKAREEINSYWIDHLCKDCYEEYYKDVYNLVIDEDWESIDKFKDNEL